jgi:hypothetical protein
MCHSLSRQSYTWEIEYESDGMSVSDVKSLLSAEEEASTSCSRDIRFSGGV